MSAHYSPFTKRLAKKLGDLIESKCSFEDAATIQRAFVAALKEEVASRWAVHDPSSAADMTIGDKAHPLYQRALVIAGLGSFKMKTRPQRTFRGGVANEINTGTVKPPARRLVFTAKWEEIK